MATSVGKSKGQELKGFFFEISAKNSEAISDMWTEIINLLTSKKNVYNKKFGLN